MTTPFGTFTVHWPLLTYGLNVVGWLWELSVFHSSVATSVVCELARVSREYWPVLVQSQS